MTPKEIAESLDRISEGPWKMAQSADGEYQVDPGGDCHILFGDQPQDKSNAAFVKSAPLALAEMLVALVEERAAHFEIKHLRDSRTPNNHFYGWKTDEWRQLALASLDIPPWLYDRTKKRVEGAKK